MPGYYAVARWIAVGEGAFLLAPVTKSDPNDLMAQSSQFQR
jgi:hypothetical protein